VDFENSEKELVDAKESLKNVISKSESQKALILGEKNQLTNNITSLFGKRESLVKQFEPSVMDIYNRLRISKNGIAVARLVDDSCSSCGSSLTANLCQQARSQAKLVYCPNCGRILFGS
jgi:predicted  nucleic acid-binding Zn-ribbon protein